MNIKEIFQKPNQSLSYDFVLTSELAKLSGSPTISLVSIPHVYDVSVSVPVSITGVCALGSLAVDTARTVAKVVVGTTGLTPLKTYRMDLEAKLSNADILSYSVYLVT